jgi:hypothetical protein
MPFLRSLTQQDPERGIIMTGNQAPGGWRFWAKYIFPAPVGVAVLIVALMFGLGTAGFFVNQAAQQNTLHDRQQTIASYSPRKTKPVKSRI